MYSVDTIPYQVRIRRGEWVDPARDGRVVTYKHYYPMDNTDALPVIVWSHGLGGSVDGAAFLARFIAGQGFHVVHVQHHGTDDTLWRGKGGNPWDHIRQTHIPRRQTLRRFTDIPFALDRITEWNASDPEFAGRFDLAHIGMSGHSFGSITTQIMAGQKLGQGRRLYTLKDPRIKAGILYSPSPSRNRTDPKPDIYGSIDIPVLHITGTNDTSPVTGSPMSHRLEVYRNAGAGDHHLLVLKDGDHWVYNGTRGGESHYPWRDRHEEILNIASLAFWNATLKNDQAALDWLKSQGFQDFLGIDATYEWKEL